MAADHHRKRTGSASRSPDSRSNFSNRNKDERNTKHKQEVGDGRKSESKHALESKKENDHRRLEPKSQDAIHNEDDRIKKKNRDRESETGNKGINRNHKKQHSASRNESRNGSESESDSGRSSSETSGSSSAESSEESDGEEERRRRRHRKRRREEKEREREREKKRKRKEKERKKEDKRMQDKKKKKKEKADKHKCGPVTDSWGKYGVIKEIDLWNKRPEFNAWLAEVKKVNLETLPDWEEKQMFKEYMEDYNAATFPSNKYYDLDLYHRRKLFKVAEKAARSQTKQEMTEFNDEEQRRQELNVLREQSKEAEVDALKRSMQSGQVNLETLPNWEEKQMFKKLEEEDRTSGRKEDKATSQDTKLTRSTKEGEASSKTKKLILFDLNGVLLKTFSKAEYRAAPPFSFSEGVLETKTKWVYPRPGVQKLLSHLKDKAQIGIWSSMLRANILEVKSVVPELMDFDFHIILDQGSCGVVHRPNCGAKDIYIKNIHEALEVIQGFQEDQICLVDDDPIKCCLNVESSINPPTWHPNDEDEENWVSDGTLELFDSLISAPTVPEFLRSRPYLQRKVNAEDYDLVVKNYC